MRVKVQLVIESENHVSQTAEIASVERGELNTGSIGFHVSEMKSIVEGLQQLMVTAQVEEFFKASRQCPVCGGRLKRKGRHTIVYRTVFGKLRLESPRLYPCQSCTSHRHSFSPLAERLPHRSSPELQYLQTKFAALMSYGLTVNLLSEVLPLDETLSVTSIRRCANRISDRLEQGGIKPDTEPMSTNAVNDYIPQPSSVKAIGIDGGYIRLAGRKSRQDGWFEVMVGKSQRRDSHGCCFAYVHRLEPDPTKRMRDFLDHEGVRPDQPVLFLSDGGDTVRQAQAGYGRFGESILDWFHISMRIQNLLQLAKGLEQTEDTPQREAILTDIERVKWYLWNGCSYRALRRLESLAWDIEAFNDSETTKKLANKLKESITYFSRNRNYIVNYGDRFRHGDPIATGFVESAVNQVVSKRFSKKQQMSWSDRNAHRLLQVRVAVLNSELRSHFERWYPELAANDNDMVQQAA